MMFWTIMEALFGWLYDLVVCVDGIKIIDGRFSVLDLFVVSAVISILISFLDVKDDNDQDHDGEA